MNDDELEKIIKNSIKQEENDWAHTKKDPLLETLANTLDCRPIQPSKKISTKTQKKIPQAKIERKKDDSWIYMLSLILFATGLYILWKKYF